MQGALRLRSFSIFFFLALSLGWAGVVFSEPTAKQISEWRKAAEQGDADAQHNLAWMYGNGEGVPEDDALAVKWWRKAAEQGHVKAQYNLGVAYDRGEGVPQDYVLSHMWSNLAAAQGNESAKENRGILANHMTADQIAEAQKLSRECLAKEYKGCEY